MFCHTCNGPLPPGDRFCKQCGAPVPGTSPVADTRRARAEGALLVVPQPGAELPDACVRCGEPAGGATLRKQFSWHPPWIFILVLLWLIVYLVVAMVLRKTINLNVPICDAHRRRRQRALWIGGGLMLGSVPLGILIGMSLRGDVAGVWGFGAGLVSFIAGLVVLGIGGQLLRPTRIDPQEAVFAGADPRFLAKLYDRQ